MVNKVVLNYLKKYSGKYNLSALRKKVLSAGYSKEEVEEALIALGLVKPPQTTKAVKPTNKAAINPPTVSKPVKSNMQTRKMPSKVSAISKQVTAKTNLVKMPSTTNSKFLKIAGICGILALVLSVLAGFLSFNKALYLTFSLLSSLAIVLFLQGFIVLGKKFSKKLVKISGWLLTVFVILIAAFQVMVVVFPEIIESFFITSFSDLVGSGEVVAITDALISLGATILVVLGLVFLFCFVLNILFGIGIKKLQENIKFAKITGILHIIGTCLLLLGVGIIILFAAFIMEIILLFKASKQV